VPVASALNFVKTLLDGISVPGGLNLSAWINPPDPDVDPATVPTAYIWPMPGSENRLTMPRNTGPGTPAGWKTERHDIGIYLVWFGDENDPDADTLFPGFIDALMDALRTAWPMPAILTDPNTGEQTQLVDTGEVMSYDSPPPRTVADQRYLRYDCLIRVPMQEELQR
jgi:hypothetical protein